TAISDVSQDSRRAIESSRVIVESAFDIIWNIEHPDGGKLPNQWIETWKVRGNKLPDGLNPLPDERGAQCRLLKIVTGRDDYFQRVASRISRRTSSLMDQVNGFGNYVAHLKKEKTATPGVAACMCYTAIELCFSILDDVAKSATSQSGPSHSPPSAPAT